MKSNEPWPIYVFHSIQMNIVFDPKKTKSLVVLTTFQKYKTSCSSEWEQNMKIRGRKLGYLKENWAPRKKIFEKEATTSRN